MFDPAVREKAGMRWTAGDEVILRLFGKFVEVAFLAVPDEIRLHPRAVAAYKRTAGRIPADAHWEKPQGKNPPLAMQKRFTVVPRGTGLVLGCCTFPTWNGYPGMFADLGTDKTSNEILFRLINTP